MLPLTVDTTSNLSNKKKQSKRGKEMHGCSNGSPLCHLLIITNLLKSHIYLI